MTNSKYQSNTGARILATIIDYILIMCFTIIYVYQFGEPNEEGSYGVSGIKAMVPILFWFFYLPFCEWKTGTTLGHWVVGLKIISENGAELTLGQSLKRRIFDLVDISLCFGLVAFIVVISTEKRQRIGDIVAKTLVIKK
ncbi:RDD family protein [Croceitalea vernalis]|uniref:RDD family protein n=1 Tax=Croceitalea vernalis TaxID=3075599 RepID=A0ABU3BKI6_9FLAO|nr:RDD family protein [Croceitalea sp. P007]MDT0622681.1 RDD family protein [Croceitalea sp. P007]